MLTKNIKTTLWSHNTNKLDLNKDKKLIIGQVPNWGDEKAIKWLFRQYDRKIIEKIAQTIPIGNWDKKSLNFWSIVLNIKPKKRINKWKTAGFRW